MSLLEIGCMTHLHVCPYFFLCSGPCFRESRIEKSIKVCTRVHRGTEGKFMEGVPLIKPIYYDCLLFCVLFPPQSQVSQKEQIADKYQRLLKEARSELQAATDAHKAQVASLTSRLHSQADSALSRLKEAALEAVNPPRPLHLTDSQLDRLRELEELTEEQEKVNMQLRREVQQVRHEMEQDKQVSKTRLTRLQQELNDARAEHQKEVAGTCIQCRVVL